MPTYPNSPAPVLGTTYGLDPSEATDAEVTAAVAAEVVRADAAYAPLSGSAVAVNLNLLGTEVSHSGFGTVSQSSNRYLAGDRQSDSGQNNEVVFSFGSTLAAGTWSMTLLHRADTNKGIYTVAVSPDAAAWTDLGTIDGYAGVAAPARTTATGLTIAAGTKFVRLKMATKNASSSAYGGTVSALTGTRTGA